MVLLLLPSPTFKHFWWRLLKPFIFTSILPPICTYTSPSHILQPLPHHAIKFPHHFPLLHCHPVQSLSLRGLRWKISATRLWRSQTLDWLESGTAQPRWALPAPTPGWLLKSSAHLHSPRVATFGGGQGRVFLQGKKPKASCCGTGLKRLKHHALEKSSARAAVAIVTKHRLTHGNKNIMLSFMRRVHKCSACNRSFMHCDVLCQRIMRKQKRSIF